MLGYLLVLYFPSIIFGYLGLKTANKIDKNQEKVQKMLSGFAAGVMVAASIWSLLIPAMNLSEDKGKLAFLPAFIGFWLGILFLLLLDRVIPHLHMYADKAEYYKTHDRRRR